MTILNASKVPLLLLPIPPNASADAASSGAQTHVNAAATATESCHLSSPWAAQRAPDGAASPETATPPSEGQGSAAAAGPPCSNEQQLRQACASQRGALNMAPPRHAPATTPSTAALGALHQATASEQQVHAECGPTAGGDGAQELRCVLLVPCCAALHGRFPLNGTYFQTNEVFMDATSLERPVTV